MCYSYSNCIDEAAYRRRFALERIGGERLRKRYFVSAFSKPVMPVITGESPKELGFFTWGMIPGWVRNAEDAEKIRRRTMNARAETIFDRPAFRRSAASRRCLVPADGFYEWRQRGTVKYPYYISLRGGQPFAFAGLWDEWTNRDTGETLRTFGIITVRANPLLAAIHNTTKRMPAILEPGDELVWLSPNARRSKLLELLRPYRGELDAWTVSKLISRRGADPDVPEAQQLFEYPELENLPVTAG